MKITERQYNELCVCGKLNFSNHILYCINWLTYFEKICLCVNIVTNEKEILKLQIE